MPTDAYLPQQKQISITTFNSQPLYCCFFFCFCFNSDIVALWNKLSSFLFLMYALWTYRWVVLYVQRPPIEGQHSSEAYRYYIWAHFARQAYFCTCLKEKPFHWAILSCTVSLMETQLDSGDPHQYIPFQVFQVELDICWHICHSSFFDCP